MDEEPGAEGRWGPSDTSGLLNLSRRQIFRVVSAALAVAAVKDPSVAQTAAYASAGALSVGSV
ncbi:hypothetical protein ACFYRC_31500 [Streptomyces sp. NPDC005279]|uniref:hypothetical protein n=1 Tax=Streptomyces sp. NPDC005279 TaxID=3364712 RepID=UPI0036BD76C3